MTHDTWVVLDEIIVTVYVPTALSASAADQQRQHIRAAIAHATRQLQAATCRLDLNPDR
ncbi:MAG TPA: hypothetical protein VHB18_15970 [Mycobacteriales bacterium]|jgi:hypothetical protein|nr:hypothetical protein [Mycobacteriales bacterium]